MREVSPTTPLPSSHRQFLLQFENYEAVGGIDAFLDRFDYTGVTAHQVYACGLGRLPESAQVAVTSSGYSPRRHLGEVLRGSEFQSELIERFLRAFPEKRRLFFVHVPKCAGSDLSAHLMRDFPYLSQLDQDPVFTPTSTLLQRLCSLSQSMRNNAPIAVMGHIGLDWLLTARLINFEDRTFSIVREPVDIAVSKVNFVLTLLLSQPVEPPLIIREWMKLLGLEDVPRSMRDEEAKRYALRFLRDPKIVPNDNMCRFLGRGDSETSFDMCASSNIELTTVSRYPAWLKKNWNIDSISRVNESRKFLKRSDLSHEDLVYLREITSQDQIVYERIERRLVASGTLSIAGSHL